MLHSIFKNIKNYRVIFLSYVLILCSACSTYTDPNTRYNSHSNRTTDNLIVPPDLESPNLNDNFKLSKPNKLYVLDQIKTAHIMTSGAERLLVLDNKNVNEVWQYVLSFLQEEGLSVKYQNQSVGQIQTNWANKNIVVHETGIRSMFTWFGLGNMYALKSQYMFKITLWQHDNNTEIFVSNFQINEVYPGCFNAKNSTIETSDHQVTKWMLMPPNSQLELDFLLNFMSYIGANNNTSDTVDNKNQVVNQQELNKNITKNNASDVTNNNKAAYLVRDAQQQKMIIINDEFDRAWWRLAIILERIGLGIVDKNRSKGEFYVYPLKSQLETPNNGFFDNIFNKSSDNNLNNIEAQYKLQLEQLTDNKLSLKLLNINDNKGSNIKDVASKDSINMNNKVTDEYVESLLKQLQ